VTAGLIGHADATRAFLAAAGGERLHHAWLLAGPVGVGKARFAELAARRLLADAAGPPVARDRLAVGDAHPVAALLAAGSHPDFRLLRRLPRDKGEELARSITVDQIRGLQPLLATTPGLSFRRTVVIDAADDLERSAANALLKNLEEPPAGTIFFLVSHAPGRLLPTIRSRCRLLRFGRLTDEEVEAVLRQERPAENAAGLRALVRIADGAPGAALRFAGLDVAGLDADIDRLAASGDPDNALRGALARALAGRPAQARYEAFLQRAPARIAAAARRQPANRLAATLDLWQEARLIADRAVARSDDPQMTVFALAGLVARLAPEGSTAKA
jgi:DNA polymerase-3 subunit delta'